MMITNLIRKIREFRMSPTQYAKHIGVKVGKGSVISTKRFPSEAYLIEIGDYVRISRGTAFETHGGITALRHIYNDPDLEICGKIKIGNYTSIGANCMIMPGVSIGNECVVAGGSIVTKSIPDGCMVAGNPAKFIGYTKDFYKRIKEKNDFGCHQLSEQEKKNFFLSQPEDKFINKDYIKLPDIK